MQEELQALYHVLESYNIGYPHSEQQYKETTARIAQLESELQQQE